MIAVNEVRSAPMQIKKSYLVPPGGERRTSFERVLVAWNASQEAARALGESLSHLKVAGSVVIRVVDTQPPMKGQAGLAPT